MSIQIYYPWSEIEEGQGFFVPCLFPDDVRKDGISAAMKLRMFRVKAEFCVMGGFIGVYFYRPPPASS